jgi:hypothetical protein
MLCYLMGIKVVKLIILEWYLSSLYIKFEQSLNANINFEHHVYIQVPPLAWYVDQNDKRGSLIVCGM